LGGFQGKANVNWPLIASSVCGCNQDLLDTHGVTIDQKRRYTHGREWFRICSRLLEGDPEFGPCGELFQLQPRCRSPRRRQKSS
jgi:hypothetical protein